MPHDPYTGRGRIRLIAEADMDCSKHRNLDRTEDALASAVDRATRTDGGMMRALGRLPGSFPTPSAGESVVRAGGVSSHADAWLP